MVAVATGEVTAVQQAPTPGHWHPRGHGVVDGLAHCVRRAYGVPGRLVRTRPLLDTVRVLAGLGAIVAVRPERVVQPNAVRDQSGALGARVCRRSRGDCLYRGRPRLPAVRAPVQIAHGQHRVVVLWLRARPTSLRPPDDRHQHIAVQHRHTHQRHQARRRRRPPPSRRSPVIDRISHSFYRLTLPTTTLYHSNPRSSKSLFPSGTLPAYGDRCLQIDYTYVHVVRAKRHYPALPAYRPGY